jgi:hypothetical protein
MNNAELQNERSRLQLLLEDFEREEAGQQGTLDRAFGEDRKRHLVSRIAYMNQKIARLIV